MQDMLEDRISKTQKRDQNFPACSLSPVNDAGPLILVAKTGILRRKEKKKED